MPATIYTKKWTRDIFQFVRRNAAMYKTRQTRTENGMPGTRGMGNVIFWGMSPNIPGMSSNIPGNAAKHSGNVAKSFNFQAVKTKSEKLLS